MNSTHIILIALAISSIIATVVLTTKQHLTSTHSLRISAGIGYFIISYNTLEAEITADEKALFDIELISFYYFINNDTSSKDLLPSFTADVLSALESRVMQMHALQQLENLNKQHLTAVEIAEQYYK